MKEYIERFLRAIETIARALDRQTDPLIQEHRSFGIPPVMAVEIGEKTTAPDADLLGMPGSAPVEAPKPARTPKPAKPAKSAENAPAGPVKPILLADVAEAVRKLIASDAVKGRENAVSILSKFGVKRISEIKEQDFPKVVEAANALLNAKK